MSAKSMNLVDAMTIANVISRLMCEGVMEEMQHESVATSKSVLDDPIEYWFRMTPKGRAIWDSEGVLWRAMWDARQQ